MSADGGESLDDFFAKKDKKKKTKKSKSAFTPDDFHPVNEKPKKKTKSGAVKAGGEAAPAPAPAPAPAAAADLGEEVATTAAKNVETKKIEEADPSSAGASSGAKGDEDEWNDFAAEQQADYSGLRIQKLNIREDGADDEEEVEYDDDGKVIPAENQVWKIPENPTCSTPEPTTEVQSTVGMEKVDVGNNGDPGTGGGTEDGTSSSSAGPQKYIPPAQRMAMKAAAGAGRGEGSVPRTLGGPRRNQRTAPDISNEELFPSLGGKSGSSKSSAWGGGLGSNASSRGQSPLTGGGKLITDVSLENKWDALTRGAE